LFDLDGDPGEKSPSTQGQDVASMKALYRARAAAIKEVEPYACKDDCLNGAYRKKQDPQGT
ncbi:MAG: hypothetical protein ACREJ3_09155, partial [Polyangiaceae bacterium]